MTLLSRIRTLIIAFAVLCSTACAAQATKRDPLPVPDIPGYRTLKCDFHMHTVFSDGEVWPTTRVAEAWRDGLDAISITDHDDYRPHAEDVKKDASRPFALASAMARQVGLILVPGIEITRGEFHFNALFVTEPNAFAGTELMAALRQAREQRAVVFWNHPHWRNVKGWPAPVDSAHKDGLFLGMEVVNGSTFFQDAYPFIEEKKLGILCNSDFHQPAPGERRNRPITLVFASTSDPEGIRDALKDHRSAAWMGGQVWGVEAHLRGLWQGAIKNLQPEIRVEGKQRSLAVQLHNTSAIPFQIKVRKAPSWFSARETTLQPESIGALAFSLNANAPPNATSVDLELELTNLHTGPNSNVVVPFSLRISRVP